MHDFWWLVGFFCGCGFGYLDYVTSNVNTCIMCVCVCRKITARHQCWQLHDFSETSVSVLGQTRKAHANICFADDSDEWLESKADLTLVICVAVTLVLATFIQERILKRLSGTRKSIQFKIIFVLY